MQRLVLLGSLLYLAVSACALTTRAQDYEEYEDVSTCPSEENWAQDMAYECDPDDYNCDAYVEKGPETPEACCSACSESSDAWTWSGNTCSCFTDLSSIGRSRIKSVSQKNSISSTTEKVDPFFPGGIKGVAIFKDRFVFLNSDISVTSCMIPVDSQDTLDGCTIENLNIPDLDIDSIKNYKIAVSGDTAFITVSYSFQGGYRYDTVVACPVDPTTGQLRQGECDVSSLPFVFGSSVFTDDYALLSGVGSGVIQRCTLNENGLDTATCTVILPADESEQLFDSISSMSYAGGDDIYVLAIQDGRTLVVQCAGISSGSLQCQDSDIPVAQASDPEYFDIAASGETVTLVNNLGGYMLSCRPSGCQDNEGNEGNLWRPSLPLAFDDETIFVMDSGIIAICDVRRVPLGMIPECSYVPLTGKTESRVDSSPPPSPVSAPTAELALPPLPQTSPTVSTPASPSQTNTAPPTPSMSDVPTETDQRAPSTTATLEAESPPSRAVSREWVIEGALMVVIASWPFFV